MYAEYKEGMVICMEFEKLEKNIMAVIKENQIKLGYREETVRLYYPLSSLNRYLGSAFTCEQMQEAMKAFETQFCHQYGKLQISNEDERFCFCLSKEVSAYVHEHTESGGFLYDLIALVSKHETGIDDMIALFHQYSDRVHVEKASHGEFDYLLYFEDGNPDDFRYCITEEGSHLIYHRYTEEDYKDFGF